MFNLKSLAIVAVGLAIIGLGWFLFASKDVGDLNLDTQEQVVDSTRIDSVKQQENVIPDTTDSSGYQGSILVDTLYFVFDDFLKDSVTLGFSIYNFKRNNWEWVVEYPEDMSPYIPQTKEALSLYNFYIKKGFDSMQAAAIVLVLATGGGYKVVNNILQTDIQGDMWLI